METIEIVTNKHAIKEKFIADLEHKLHKEFLMDWAMGWVLDMVIDSVYGSKVRQDELFRTIFSTWRDKCLQLCIIVMDHNDDESHLYAGLDMTQLSEATCHAWRERFEHLSSQLKID